jgi:hypothetical protein
MRIFLFSIKSAFEVEGEKMKYLVIGSEGPGFASPEESVELLEKGVFPTFDALLKLETEKKILAGGLPVADRALVFILEASSNDEADQILRDIPAWGVLKWKVTPLQSFAGRANYERSLVEEIKKKLRSK